MRKIMPTEWESLNPLPPSVPFIARLAKILILEAVQGIIKKISYERRDYESVDKKSPSNVQKNSKKFRE